MTICTRTICQLSLAVAWAGVAGAQSPPLWGKLPPGPHAVGFNSTWQLDYSRRYNTTFDDRTTYAPAKAPRPILVNQWYPAKKSVGARPMLHREYLDLRSDDPRLTKFATRLADYERSVIAREVMGKPAAELTDREKSLLDQFLDTPTGCVRGAEPVRGSFPLVIYHAGAGSSYEDNSVLCEFLASHGFVVLGSAFQQESGESFNTDNQRGSAGDMAFLTAYARQIPGVDWGHVGVVGHSAGAQAALMYRSQLGCAADAIVSLDTTQDYHAITDPMWESFTPQVVKNSKNFTCPVLMVAGPHAVFDLADSLQRARRYYLTVKGVDHNDYISQGGISRDRLHQLHRADPGQTAEARAREEEDLERAKAGYQAVCTYVLNFLAAELKGDAAAGAYLVRQYRDTRLGGAEPHVEYVPEGRSGPDPYTADSPVPPTPRQLRHFLRERGSDNTIALLKRFRKQVPDAPVFYPTAELYLVSDLLDQGKIPEAAAFGDYFRESGQDCGKLLFKIARGYESMGRTNWAIMYYKRVVLLEPSNREAADRLKELAKGQKDTARR